MPRGPPADTNKYYELLGVTKSADAKDIKKAFRKKAMKLHPDRGGDEEAFIEVQKAYETLSDEKKRAIYDKWGEKGLEQGASGPDILRDLFTTRPQERDSKPHAPLIEDNLRITLEEAYQGTTIPLEIEYRTASASTICSVCQGRGTITDQRRHGMMILQSQRECPQCYGRKMQFKDAKTQKKTIQVSIPKGTCNEDFVKMEGEGHQLPGHHGGDVKVKIWVQSHHVFDRVGADLILDHPVTLLEALTGITLRITHLSGTTLVIKHKAGSIIRPGSIMVIKEWGMPQKGGRRVFGNLNVNFSIKFPKQETITKKHKQRLRKALANLKWTKEPKVPSLGPGCRLKIKGISPEIDGMTGVFISEMNDRYVIKLDQKEKTASIPPEHLEFVEGDVEDPTVKLVKIDDEDDGTKGYVENILKANVEIEGDAVTNDLKSVAKNIRVTPASVADIGDDEPRGSERVQCKTQ